MEKKDWGEIQRERENEREREREIERRIHEETSISLI